MEIGSFEATSSSRRASQAPASLAPKLRFAGRLWPPGSEELVALREAKAQPRWAAFHRFSSFFHRFSALFSSDIARKRAVEP